MNLQTNVLALGRIVESAQGVTHNRTRKHLRAAFIALSNEIVSVGLATKETSVQCGSVSFPATLNGVTINEVELRHVLDKRKLDAVKEYKNRTGKPLMDCKKDIESWAAAAGLDFNHTFTGPAYAP